MPAGEAATLRLDKWLWFARLTKSRSLAARLCEAGAVASDVVTVPQGRVIRTVHVAALGKRRGPATEARQLYLEPDPPQRLAQEAWTKLLDDSVDDAPTATASHETLSLRERAG